MVDQLMIDFILRAVDRYRAGEPGNLSLIVECLEDSQAAKQVLRKKGYGWTGLNILKTAEMVHPEVSS